MGKKAKTGKNRQDKFYHLAKEQGFRSRASFKLVQLNKRYDFLSSASRGVLDLCAAPGGWMQVARKHMPLGAPCIGIDLVPIRPVPGCIGLVGDITTDQCRSDLRRALKEHPSSGADQKVDAVLNDGSPNMGKAWLQDAYTQSELTLAAVRLAADFLAPGGTFVTKVFRSNDYNSLMFVMNQLFGKVNATKPSASRAESAEIYVLCTGFKAPKSIDPRLLNPKYVFKDMGTASTNAAADADGKKPDLVLNSVLKMRAKQKRHREGYADGALTMFTRVSALEFVRTERPVAMMCEASAFSFDVRDVTGDADARACEILRTLPETTPELLDCCEDLKVLGRSDFKRILKWRVAARERLTEEKLLKHPTGEDDESEEEADNAEQANTGQSDHSSDSENALEDELQTARQELEAKEKRKKRKANKLRSALQRKIDMKIVLPNEDNNFDGEDSAGLFKLSTAMRAENHGVDLDDAEDPNDGDDEGGTDDDLETTQVRPKYTLQNAAIAADERETEVADELDHWYKVYLSRKKRDKNGALLEESKDRKRRTKRKALRDAEKRAAEGTTEGETTAQNGAGSSDGDSANPRMAIDSDESSDADSDAEVHMGRAPVSSREAALWFSQPVFDGALVSSDDGGRDDAAESDGSEAMGRDAAALDDAAPDIHAAARREARQRAEEIAKERTKDGFEVVPAEKPPSDEDEDADNKNMSDETGVRNGSESESSFHSSDYDTDEKAEMVAIGMRMRQSKREANEVLDDAYNRYTFDDPLDLPRWFADPDPQYRFRREPIVSKEQVAEMKAYIKSLQAAPSKKEAEAKARRRARATKKIEAMKNKANSIAEQEDVSAGARMKAIEQLYRQASKASSSKKTKRKQYVAVQGTGPKKVIGGDKTGRGRKSARGAYTVLVDKRMKSDKRGMAKAERRKQKKGKS